MSLIVATMTMWRRCQSQSCTGDGLMVRHGGCETSLSARSSDHRRTSRSGASPQWVADHVQLRSVEMIKRPFVVDVVGHCRHNQLEDVATGTARPKCRRPDGPNLLGWSTGCRTAPRRPCLSSVAVHIAGGCTSGSSLLHFPVLPVSTLRIVEWPTVCRRLVVWLRRAVLVKLVTYRTATETVCIRQVWARRLDRLIKYTSTTFCVVVALWRNNYCCCCYR